MSNKKLVSIHKNQGTYQKCRHEDRNDLELPPGIPEKPDYLNKLASKEWDRVVPLLAEHGIISDIDGPSIALYCELYDEFINTRTCPAAFNAAKISAMRAALADLGMCPIARTKIPGKEKPPPAGNPFQGLTPSKPAAGNKKKKRGRAG